MTTGHLPLATSHCRKSAFGLIEVIVASVVLGFLIIGLLHLQMGNREGVLRVRARDAAKMIAEHVLDSLGAVGINSLVAGAPGCGNGNFVLCNTGYDYHFEGKTGVILQRYTVAVALLDNNASSSSSCTVNSNCSIDSTDFTRANRTVQSSASSAPPSDNEINRYAKSLEATVSWKHKNSTQSITIAKVVR